MGVLLPFKRKIQFWLERNHELCKFICERLFNKILKSLTSAGRLFFFLANLSLGVVIKFVLIKKKSV